METKNRSFIKNQKQYMSDEQKIIFSMVGVNKIFPPHKQVLKDIYLSFFYGAKIGIIGLNGSGKSTLLKIIAGIEKSYQGEVVFSPGYPVGYLEQDPQLDDAKTVKEIVQEGVQEIVDLLKEYEEVNNRFMEPMSDDEMNRLMIRQGELTEQIEHAGGWDLDSKLERAMDALRCPDGDAQVAALSGGERRRVALCRLLLREPDILLLDEPTNHLDAESVQWLEMHLQQYRGTVIAITHDRYFLDNVAGWILELDRGEGIPWKGNYSSWLEQKTKRMAQEEKQESKRRKTLERELEWVRMAPKARHAKAKARLSAYDRMMSEDVKQKEERLEIFIPNGPRLGDRVIEAQNVSMAYGDRLLFDNLSFKLPPAGIVGVIGPNGAGKTTLFRLIMGMEKPDTGAFETGETVKISYVDQSHRDIDPEKTVYQVLSQGNDLISLGGKQVNARAYVSRFNFSGADQEKKCSMLSGGERNRLHLALALKEEGNVLLLDEPTNDIDVNTLRALEEGLEDFAGCAVVISHDRWFLDRIATHILAFEGNSNVYFFEGSYSEYEENRKKRLGDEGPKRIRYRKLM
jgi:ATP-binding cassette ChvD family protein